MLKDQLTVFVGLALLESVGSNERFLSRLRDLGCRTILVDTRESLDWEIALAYYRGAERRATPFIGFIRQLSDAQRLFGVIDLAQTVFVGAPTEVGVGLLAKCTTIQVGRQIDPTWLDYPLRAARDLFEAADLIRQILEPQIVPAVT